MEMVRQLTVVLLSVSLWAGSAYAVGWTQDFDVGVRNVVEWAGGVGSARGENRVTIAEKQSLDGGCYRLSAVQKAQGTILQSATINGTTGPSQVRQNADAAGTQYIPIDSKGGFAGGAWQNLGVSLQNYAFKPDGVGSVNGTQSFVGGQMQAITTPYFRAVQSQHIDATQNASITTTTPTDPVVRSTINIKMTQNSGLPR
jgi:hypothetical protein